MEETSVLIIGAGPSGLALGLTLAKHKISSIILEKDKEITEDPRGVTLQGDSIRIFYDLGLGDEDMKALGHVAPTMNFHRSTFKAQPFYSIDIKQDFLNQSLPPNLFMIQPKLEAHLEDKVKASKYCTLNRGCTAESVESTEEENVLTYTDTKGLSHQVKSKWVVGADGKKGVLRKQVLEPSAGVKQENGIFQYEGTWIAANLRIHLPTPSTHPDLPFWKAGMTPQDVYDLYWPEGWHFCTPPGKPTATGRFGPYEDRMWRHEFAEPDWNDSKDADALLWEHITPMITRDVDARQNRSPGGQAVTFPKDCIEVKRNRPYTFVHKVVNKWFDGRRVLIGDAAHVYPPFGSGQGIASGVRDAHQLGWRLALMVQNPKMRLHERNEILQAWASERRQSVNDAATMTKMNGTLCNYPETWGFFVFRHLERLRNTIPLFSKAPNPMSLAEKRGFRSLPLGLFLEDMGGGGKVPQVFVRNQSNKPQLSDKLLRQDDSVMTVLLLGEVSADVREAVRSAVRTANIPSSILSTDPVILVQAGETHKPGENDWQVIRSQEITGCQVPHAYDDRAFSSRLGAAGTIAIVRPDFYIFACVSTVADFEVALQRLRKSISLGV